MARIVPWILAVAVFMDQMDSSALATVLPAIARDFGLEPMALKLALTSYIVAFAIVLPACGWLARRHGAERLFRAALLLFMAGSLGCALSSSLAGLVAARFVQGLGAAIMIPVARIIIVRDAPREQLVAALAWWTLPAMAAPILGPLIGGAFATFASWHWIFLINLPIGAAGWLLARRHLRDTTEPAAAGPFDGIGFILTATSFAALIFGLSVLRSDHVPTGLGPGLIVLGAVAAIAALTAIRHAAHPLFDLGLFADRAFRTSISGGFLFRVGTGAVHFLMPLLLQLGFGLTPLQSGLLTFSGAIGAILSKLCSSALYDRFGYAGVLLPTGLAVGALQATAGLFQPGIAGWVIVGYMAVGGLLRSTVFAGASALGYATIAQERVGDVSILSSVTQQLAAGSGIAVAGALVDGLSPATAPAPPLVALQIALAITGAVSALGALFFIGPPPSRRAPPAAAP